jgi:hypothetical protein
MTNEERLTTLEDLSALLVKLARNAHERLDTHTEAQANFETKFEILAEAQANSEAKIAALADAQIRTEAAMEMMAQRVSESMSTLAAAQTHTDQRLDALIDIVRKRFESESQG